VDDDLDCARGRSCGWLCLVGFVWWASGRALGNVGASGLSAAVYQEMEGW